MHESTLKNAVSKFSAEFSNLRLTHVLNQYMFYLALASNKHRNSEMTMQTLERIPLTIAPPGPNILTAGGEQRLPTADRISTIPTNFDLEAELGMISGSSIETIDDRDELGRLIMQSAMSSERGTFAVKSRSAAQATDFATPMRSALMTLSSGFGGISATVSPSLNLHTWPAMDMLVADLEASGAGELWQPIGERSIGIGASRHVFVSVDNPVRNDATRVYPTTLVEIVGAHLIDPEWFDRVVEPRCQDESLTFVYYGQVGFEESLFERAWYDSELRGII